MRILFSPVIAGALFVIGCVMLSVYHLDAQVYKWSQTAGNNSTADPNVNWSEGQSPSSVNDSARAMMAALAEVRDDWSGANAGSGTSSAYTVSSNQGFGSLANMNNQQVCFTPNNTNATGVTLAVDGLAAEPIDSAPNAPIGAGVMVQGTPYCVVYNNSNAQFYLRQFVGNPFNIPLGGVMIYTGSSAPNSNFVLAFGQCISRATYAAYFSLVSTTFNACDGVTTFGVPDIRGRVVAGLDNMGGVSAANLAAQCSSTTLGFTCGNQQQTLVAGEIPQVSTSYTPGGSISFPGGTQVISSNIGSGVNNGQPSSLVSTSASATFNGTPATITVGSASPSATPTVQPTLGLNYILRIF